MNNSMLLVTSSWGQFKTFKMIPITNDCPFAECIFDVSTKLLAVIGKTTKQSFHMLPKLTDTGDVQYLKLGKKANGKDYAEERKVLETLYEYYVEDLNEVKEFIKMFAINADSFNTTTYFEMVTTVPESTPPSIITAI